MAAHLRLRGGRPQEAPKPPPLRLVNSDKVLSYRAHSPYVLWGFRPDNDTSITHALFRLHNESFNIWSHLAGTIIFVLPRIIGPGVEGAPWLSAALRCHAIVAACCGFASAAYHVCESWPTSSYSRLLALDYTMAYVATVSHSFLIACFETRDQPLLCAALITPLLLLGAKGAHFFLRLQSNNTTDSRASVVRTMVAPFILALPLILRALLFPSAITPVLLRWMAAFVVATLAWVLELPERLFRPGTFDLIGKSHNVMHVMVLVVWQELHLGIRGLVELAVAA